MKLTEHNGVKNPIFRFLRFTETMEFSWQQGTALTTSERAFRFFAYDWSRLANPGLSLVGFFKFTPSPHPSSHPV